MKFENIIDELLNQFPILNKDYEREKNYIEGLAYPCFETIFVKYINKMCLENNIEELKKICSFIEICISSNDEKVSQLIIVAVLEGILPNREAIQRLKKYALTATLQHINELEKFYGWSNK